MSRSDCSHVIILTDVGAVLTNDLWNFHSGDNRSNLVVSRQSENQSPRWSIIYHFYLNSGIRIGLNRSEP